MLAKLFRMLKNIPLAYNAYAFQMHNAVNETRKLKPEIEGILSIHRERINLKAEKLREIQTKRKKTEKNE